MPWDSQSYQSALQTDTEQIGEKIRHLLIRMVQCELIRGTGNELLITEAVKAGRGA